MDGMARMPLTWPQTGEIHLWFTSLPPQTEVTDLTPLSVDERHRATQYRTPQGRHQFVSARIGLRLLLGIYLQQPPEGLCFTYSPHGKPALAQQDADCPLTFNVSHSRDRILYAVGSQGEIGVDLEGINPSVQALKLARRICTPQEWTAFLQLSPTEQNCVFLGLWTRKEALLKLLGDRLFPGLSSLAVPLAPLGDGTWVWVHRQRLWLQDLALEDRFVGAIATSEPIQTLRYRTWDELDLPITPTV